MGIVNKRNAFVGWIVLKNRKRLVKMARSTPAAPGAHTGGIVAGVLAGIVGIASGLLFWRKKRDSVPE
jgi:LPXTG-motif cell wall-anchored protein